MISTANAILLGKALHERKEKIDDVDTIMKLTERVLRDEKLVMEQTENVMKFIFQSRMNDIKTHDIEKSEAEKYIKAWTANYEISDYLQRFDKLTPNVFFLRHNQWPERHVATYEEKKRLVEEKPFGDRVDSDKSQDDASPFIMESFLPKHILTKPKPIRNHNNVCILDTNGHFVISVPLLTRREVVIINTTESHYIKSDICIYLKNLLL